MNYDYASSQQTLYANNGGTTLSEYIEYTAQQPTWTKSYVYLGGGLLSTATSNGQGGENIEFNHPDRLGTRTITNQAAGTSSEQATLPFGTALNAESTRTNNPNRFTSYDRSNISGLDYAVNRSYDSKQGRFTQVDPIKMGASSLASPQTLNLYTYCGNDPINHTDPDGLFFGSLFRWIGKILKAVMIAVAVALIVIALVLMPSVAPILGYTVFAKMFAAAGVLLAQALAPPKIGAIIGIVTGLILAGPGIIVNFAETINKMARWQKLLMASNFVGAIANSFAQKKKDEKKRRGIIEQTVSRVVSRLNKKPKCLKTINHDGYDLSPAAAISEIFNRGNIQWNKDLDVSAQTGPNQTSDGVIELGSSFFDKIIKDVRGNNWNKITGLNEHRTREFIILHELRHLFGSDHSMEGGLERDVTEILKDCFGVTPNLSGGIK